MESLTIAKYWPQMSEGMRFTDNNTVHGTMVPLLTLKHIPHVVATVFRSTFLKISIQYIYIEYYFCFSSPVPTL